MQSGNTLSSNRAWNLESFLDSLIIELDKARETLAVKAINRPLTYTVKDVALDLQLFPRFDGKQVKFTTAKPGETGASKVSIQLGSITDQQIRATTKKPISKDDISIDIIEDIDEEAKESLRKIGVSSVTDLQNIEEKNVDLEKVSNKKVSYSNLANILKKARRGDAPPVLKTVSIARNSEEPVLVLKGKNLAVDQSFKPVAVLNEKLAKVLSANDSEIKVKLNETQMNQGDNQLVMTLDPYAIFKINIHNPH